jgi:nicotinamide-nucleotide amidase
MVERNVVSMKAEILAIGDELTTGQRLDTNSRWLSRELGLLGVVVCGHTTVPDTVADGVRAFAAARERADIVLATGGLGPTADDLTREVLAEVAGEPLELVPKALQAIEAMFAARGRAMTDNNRLQAMLPRSAAMIPNPTGTAPGIDLPATTAPRPLGRVFALPGVPSEMFRMWADSVQPAILAMAPDGGTMQFRVLKCFGAGESAIEAMLPDLIRRGRDPLVGITAHEATITLRIAARSASDEACRAAIAPVEATIRECLGDLVFGEQADELEDATVRFCQTSGLRVAVVEGATQGRVATLLAEADGRQETCVFAGANQRGTGTACGDMVETALACRRELQANVALAVGDLSSDAEGREWLPIAIVTDETVSRHEHLLGGAGSLRLSRAAKTALDMLRRHAAGLPPLT